MRGTAAFVCAKNRFKQIYPIKGSWGSVATSVPKKHESNDSAEEGAIGNVKTDPIVAFSRPPPLPPFLGPLVVLSLLETWSGRDSNDD